MQVWVFSFLSSPNWRKQTTQQDAAKPKQKQKQTQASLWQLLLDQHFEKWCSCRCVWDLREFPSPTLDRHDHAHHIPSSGRKKSEAVKRMLGRTESSSRNRAGSEGWAWRVCHFSYLWLFLSLSLPSLCAIFFGLYPSCSSSKHSWLFRFQSSSVLHYLIVPEACFCSPDLLTEPVCRDLLSILTSSTNKSFLQVHPTVLLARYMVEQSALPWLANRVLLTVFLPILHSRVDCPAREDANLACTGLKHSFMRDFLADFLQLSTLAGSTLFGLSLTDTCQNLEVW